MESIWSRQGGLAGDDKYATWEEIKVLTFTRAVAASWMVSLLDLLNRVQLNILGRHLYLQSNILDARQVNHIVATQVSSIKQLRLCIWTEYFIHSQAS